MTLAMHVPHQHAVDQFDADIEQVQASTRRLLLALLEYQDSDLAEAAATGLGTRRHILARLVRHSDRAASALNGGAAPTADDALLRAPLSVVVDRVTTSLGSALDAIGGARRGGLLLAAMAVVADHLAWLELTLVDLGDGYTVSKIPDPAINAISTHFATDRNSPFTELVA